MTRAKKGPLQIDCDTLIVGGGFAGVTAGRELSHAGQSVILFEGRDRLGGRTWYREVPELERSLEMGGTWVHWFQPYVFTEITRYGIEMVESIGCAAPEKVIYRAEGERRDTPIADAWPMIADAFSQFFGDNVPFLMPRPFEPLLRLKDLRALDGLSLQQRIAQSDLSREQRDVLNGLWCLCVGNKVEEGGFLTLMRWYALSAYTASGFFDTLTRFKLKTGTKSLIDAMSRDSDAEVCLSEPVSAVHQSEDIVAVRLRSGREFRASHAIVAVPLNTLGDIEFSPPLSPTKQDFVAEKQASLGLKLWVRIRGDLKEPMFAIAPENEQLVYAQTEEIYDDGQLVVIFAFPGIDPDSVDEVTPHVRRLLGDDLEVVATAGKTWLNDEFSQGGWSVYRPNQLTRYLAEIQRAEGRVHFAGSDTASGWNGFIDGAIETGLRAAHEISMDTTTAQPAARLGAGPGADGANRGAGQRRVSASQRTTR